MVTFIALALILFKYYLKNYTNVKEWRFDLETQTVDDWSIELPISKKQYSRFKLRFEENEKTW